jgi:hypothetical protein
MAATVFDPQALFSLMKAFSSQCPYGPCLKESMQAVEIHEVGAVRNWFEDGLYPQDEDFKNPSTSYGTVWHFIKWLGETHGFDPRTNLHPDGPKWTFGRIWDVISMYSRPASLTDP